MEITNVKPAPEATEQNRGLILQVPARIAQKRSDQSGPQILLALVMFVLLIWGFWARSGGGKLKGFKRKQRTKKSKRGRLVVMPY